MELLLNLLWLAASATVGVLFLNERGWRFGESNEKTHSNAAAWVSYLILVAMLLPVISMTDDLHAVVTPADGEQIVRRIEATVPGHSLVHFHQTPFLQVRSVWLAPVFEACPLETVRDSFPSYYWHRQTPQGRAPPAVA